ncbi:AraC-like DNA-binding protein [Streptomyces filamentosus]
MLIRWPGGPAFAHAFKCEFGAPPGRYRREERQVPQPA